MALATISRKILEYLNEHPDGAHNTAISTGVGSTSSNVSQALKVLQHDSWVEPLERGVWRITEAGQSVIGVTSIAKAAEKPTGAETGVEKVEVREVGDVMVHHEGAEEAKPIPGEYEKFQAICRSIGVRDDFVKTITDYMFTSDMHDLNYVWDSLQGMALRPDVTKRIFNAWTHVINQPVPIEIAKQIIPSTVAAEKAAEAREQKEKKYIVVGNEIIADSEGDFSFGQARSLIALTAAKQVAPGTSSESVSAIINAIEPIITRREASEAAAETKKQETTIVQAALEALKEKGGGGNQFMTFTDMVGFLDSVNKTMETAKATASGGERPSSLDELAKMAMTFKTLKEVFAPAQSGGPAQVLVNLPGANGQSGAIPWDAYVNIEEYRSKRHKEDLEFQDRRETASVGRDFLKKISNVVGSLGE